jgi:hypothetical protein
VNRAKREASMRVSPGKSVIREYQKLSPEDRRTFDRWLKANAIFGAVLAVGMLAMALANINSVGPDAEIAAVVTPPGPL